MGKLSSKSDYETLRNARITENKARLESMGLLRTAEELKSIIVASSPATKGSTTGVKRSHSKPRIPDGTPVRRSSRLMNSGDPAPNYSDSLVSFVDDDEEKTGDRKAKRKLFSVCSYRGGKVYDSLLGISCHFCRQKTLCGEEDCKRCVDRDINQPCIGKTECSSCHSNTGVLCRPCLRIRYGEEMEEVRANKEWMCPHCIEEKGLNPYWICNSSFCMKRRKMVPTGIAIYHARELGYKSVAHLIMDKLKNKA